MFCQGIKGKAVLRHYSKTVPPILYEFEKEIKYDHYFLFDINAPWVADGLRDLGNERAEMFQVFKEELEKEHFTIR